MLAMTVVQRGVGFFRGIWFCRLLDDAVVGQWSMAYDFIVMVTPIMLLGIPGSLPRYAEHFRHRGHLPALVLRLFTVTAILGGLFFTLLLCFPEQFGWFVFLDPQSTSLVVCIGVTMLATVAFNSVYQLVSSLRQVRVGSVMQFAQSVGFTLLSLAWLYMGGGVAGLILAFGLATLLAMTPGLFTLSVGWKGLPPAESPMDAASMWRRLLPYAAALWTMNLLMNIFMLSDRYMILHLLPAGGLDGQSAVGQYHSSRIIPLLFMSVATMLAGVLLPYLTADWEAGRKDAVRQSMRRMLFGVSIMLTLGAAASLWVAPWFFQEVLDNRYSAGLRLMPMAFVFAIWYSLLTVGQNYLWIAERGKLVAISIAIGLCVNVTLNLFLLPMWGLFGAVFATMVAHLAVLMCLWQAMKRHGYPLDESTFFVTVLPATLLAGPWISVVCIGVVCLFSTDARRWIRDGFDWLVGKVSGKTVVG